MNPVLQDAHYIAQHAQHVAINYSGIQNFIQSFIYQDTPHWYTCSPYPLPEMTLEEELTLLLLFNTLSFSYWGTPKWTVTHKGYSEDGSWGLLLACARALEEGVPLLTPQYWATISFPTFAHILRGNVEIPMLRQRWTLLQAVGKALKQHSTTTITSLITDSQNDTITLLSTLQTVLSPWIHHTSYQGRPIAFHKKFQLFTADIYQLLKKHHQPNLSNIDYLTVCADYKLPQILRSLAILTYSTSLAQQLRNHQELPPNSPEEVEILGCTIWAAHLITKELQVHHPSLHAFQLNDLLWLSTQHLPHHTEPYHRTRTTAY